ncbi:MAG TPA: tetratricopeptide repeat protein [Thermodesulfobacteriota bacterium]|nr:tetratricopeptide repeat protein [Thermodesulfobacteriota bacterium]
MKRKQLSTGVINFLIREARWLIDQGNYEEALTKLQKCLQNEMETKGRLLILKELGYCYLRLGWFKEAVEAFNQFLEINSFDSDARYFRASAYASLKWIEEAIKELRIILTTNSNDVLARHDLALCYRDKGWIKEALNEIKKANDSAKIYGNEEERRIVASSLRYLEDENKNANERDFAAFLALILLLRKMRLKMKRQPRAIYPNQRLY